jgi:hypothetical protein
VCPPHRQPCLGLNRQAGQRRWRAALLRRSGRFCACLTHGADDAGDGWPSARQRRPVMVSRVLRDGGMALTAWAAGRSASQGRQPGNGLAQGGDVGCQGGDYVRLLGHSTPPASMAGRSPGGSAARTARRTPGHPAAHPPWPVPPAAAAPPPAATTPTTSTDRLWCGTRPRSLLTQGVQAILSTPPAVITDRHASFQGELSKQCRRCWIAQVARRVRH